jgi:ABC-type transport system involved in multi-copper enzyme maturation permease subunit
VAGATSDGALGLGRATGKGRPLSDLEQFVEAFRFQFLSFLRTWRFLVMLLLTILGTSFLVLFELFEGGAGIQASFGGSSVNFLESALSLVPTYIIFVAALFGADTVAIDYGTAAGYYTLVLPIRRQVLLLGRYAAAFVATAALVLVYYVVIAGVTVHLFGNLPAALFTGSVLLALGYVLGVLSLAVALGSLFRRPVVAIIAVVLLTLIAFPLVQLLCEFESVEPSFLITYAGAAITNVFNPPPHVIVSGGPGFGFTTYTATIPEAAVIMLAYAVIGLVLTMVVCEYKELTG